MKKTGIKIEASLLLHLIFLLKTSFCSSTKNYYNICRFDDNSCNSDQTIRFPFFIQDRNDPSCGYEGFNVSCNSEGHPIFYLKEEKFHILHINYGDQLIKLRESSISESHSCVPLVHNVSIDGQTLKIPTNQKKLYFLGKCGPEDILESDKKITGCKGSPYEYAVFEDNPSLPTFLDTCGEVVIVPVEVDEHDVTKQLKKGFHLKWEIQGNCSHCEENGGACGFDYTHSKKFTCFCPDGHSNGNSSTCKTVSDKKSDLPLKLGTGFSVGLLVILIIAISIYGLRGGRRRRSSISKGLSSSKGLHGEGIFDKVAVFSYSELQRATSNFSSDQELGNGGFGTVYYGKLKDGREVAVKKMYEHNYRRMEQFVNEIDILRRVRHRNLVTLYGCTAQPSKELLLVYEFISNGTVFDHLHGDRAELGALKWPIRMNIAVETAAALAYLHVSDIIHRDVKTTNILLDNDFCVKVADFGLSRLFPLDRTHVSTAPQGTPGYVDPDYNLCYKLTDKSDVYSFGVVLIELISSLPAVDVTRHRSEINLAPFALKRIQKCAYDELIDHRLGYEVDDEVTRMTTAVADLAFRCLQHDTNLRPTMSDVLKELKQIQTNGEQSFEDIPAPFSPPTSDEDLRLTVIWEAPIPGEDDR